MKLSIEDKVGVLAELRSTLHICEVVLEHSEKMGEPPEARIQGTRRRDRLREAMRFIEENS